MIYIAIIIIIFTGEFFIKSWMERKADTFYLPILKEKILLRKLHNKGAFLNLGERKSKVIAWISVFLCIVCTGIFIVTLSNKGSSLLKAGLALLLGGAYSNTYDRISKQYVVDYFSFGVKWKGIKNVVFNISDFAILIGSICVVLGERENL